MSAPGITEDGLMAAILDRFPGFGPDWQAHLDYWEDEERLVGNDVAEFSAYVRKLLAAGERSRELEEIFAFAEVLMREGTEAVKDQIATNFLENIVNGVGEDPGMAELFVGLLGPASLQFCKEWNAFSGGGIPALDRA